VTDSTIRLELAAPFAEIILNKPERRNALSLDMWCALPDLIGRAETSDEVKVVIIHGGKAGAFAAGADITEFERIYATEQSAAQSGQVIADALAAVERCKKPVIAAIEGACVGGGLSLALAADLRIAAKGAKFGVTPGKLGLVYSAADTRRLMAAIGPSRAKDILYTGRLFGAGEARDMGLVNSLVDDDTALGQARILGGQIAEISQWSVRATKAMIAGLEGGWADDAPEADTLFLEGFSNEDFQEGYRAFLDKRTAQFTYK
jgi:enoyl-CoA hydratase/carnithine racemase